MFRQVMKGLLALCVVAAMSFVGTTSASAAGDGTARSGSVAKAGAPCAKQKQKVAKAKKKATPGGQAREEDQEGQEARGLQQAAPRRRARS